MDNSQFRQLIQQYIHHSQYEKGLDCKTLKAYNTDLTQFADFVLDIGGQYTKETLQAYIAKMNQKYAVKSAKRKLASLKAFFNYLEYEEILEHNPFSKMRVKMQEPMRLPRTIPLPTVSSLLQCAYNQRSHYKEDSYSFRACVRDIAVLELLFASGIRISELCFLRPHSVDLNEGIIKIFGKGAKERLIQISNDNVLNALINYSVAFSNEIDNSSWFFVNRLGHRLSDQSVRQMINKYCKLANIRQHITPHMFRHSFATYLLEEDVDIRYIQNLLGHSSIVTTQIYTHVTSKKQRDILAAKHPRNKITTP